MKIIVIPKIIIRHKNQIEFAVEDKLIKFLKKCFKNSSIEIIYDLKFKKDYDLCILSGGNTLLKFSKKENDKLRDRLNNFYYLKSKRLNKTVIGICYGAQFISSKYKSKFKKQKNHINYVQILKYLDTKKYVNIKTRCFHDYNIIYSNSKNLEIILRAKDKSIESFKIKNKKIGGIIWHPERSPDINKQIMFFKKFYAIISSSIR